MGHETHLFVEGENAPATDVAAVIKKVYEEVKGDLLVASRSNKVGSYLLASWGLAHMVAQAACFLIAEGNAHHPSAMVCHKISQLTNSLVAEQFRAISYN